MLYVHLKKTVKLENSMPICLGHVAQLYAGKDGQDERVRSKLESDFKQLIIGRSGGTAYSTSIVTGADLARVLDGKTEFSITGAPFCLVLVKPLPERGKIMPWVKVAVLMALLFAGGAMTIMNFQTDVDMQSLHKTLSEILAGKGSNPLWVSIPYSLGIGGGVLFFSNLLPGKRKEPSIFEIEQFEMDVERNDYESSKAEDQL